MREIRHSALPNINCNAFVINERAILLIVRALPSGFVFSPTVFGSWSEAANESRDRAVPCHFVFFSVFFVIIFSSRYGPWDMRHTALDEEEEE